MALKLDAKIPAGALAEKWSNHKTAIKVVSPANKRKLDIIIAGTSVGRVRAMVSDKGQRITEAGPSVPVEITGLSEAPSAGATFNAVADEKLARRIAEMRATKQRERDLASESKVTLETFLSRRASDQETLTLNLVLKADVQGSLEAITEALNKQSTEKVRINVVHGGTGAISESDIMLASASQAIIIGFNVRPTSRIKDIAERENVDIRFYDIIYKLVDDIKSAMAGLLAPVQREVYLGQAEVRNTFSVPKVGIIAGVCTLLAENNVNILDISQTIMEGYFTMMMVVDLAECRAPFDTLRASLKEYGESRGLSIRIQREDIFDAMHKL